MSTLRSLATPGPSPPIQPSTKLQLGGAVISPKKTFPGKVRDTSFSISARTGLLSSAWTARISAYSPGTKESFAPEHSLTSPSAIVTVQCGKTHPPKRRSGKKAVSHP